jgi:hypothetical protein
MINSHYVYKGDGLYVYEGPYCRTPPLGHDFNQDRTEETKGYKCVVYRCQLCGTEYGKESSQP